VTHITLLRLRTHSFGSLSVRSQQLHFTVSRILLASLASSASAFMGTPFFRGFTICLPTFQINIRASYPNDLEKAF
jgi:hypothetical protein